MQTNFPSSKLFISDYMRERSEDAHWRMPMKNHQALAAAATLPRPGRHLLNNNDLLRRGNKRTIL